MGLINRIHDIFLANAHHAVDQAENPEVMVKQVIRELDQKVQGARASVVKAVSAEKQLEAQVNRHRSAAEGLQRKAESVLKTGREDLAREALTRKAEHDDIAEDLERSWNSTKSTCGKLKAQLDKLVEKRADACRQREVLLARQCTAQARSRVTRSISALSVEDTSGETLARMQQRVGEMESEAAAVVEVLEEEAQPDKEINEVETAGKVEEALQAMKTRLEQQAPAP